jgi:hypothetical protein
MHCRHEALWAVTLSRRVFVRGAGLTAAGMLAPLAAAPAGAAGNEESGLAPPPPTFSSNHNYFIYGGGQPIRGLMVTIEVAEDIAAPTGLNMQLNAYSPKGATCVYQQYCMGIDPKFETRLGWSNENFPSKEYRWLLHNTHGLPCHVPDPSEQTCKGDIFNMHGVVGFFPRITNRLPARAKLIWELIDNANGAIVGAQYSFVNPQGKKTSTGPQLIKTFNLEGGAANVDADAVVPIYALQMNIVGLNNGAHAELGSGAGSITYQAASMLTPLGKQPPDVAAQNVFTAESSNIKYDQVGAQSQQKIVQNFRVAAPA